MPVTYRVVENGNLVVTTGVGVITDDDLFRYALTLLSDSRLHPGWDEIIDFRRATESYVTEEGLKRIADSDSQHIEQVRGGRVAIIVSNKEHAKLARTYEKLAAQNMIEVIVFSDLDTACTWIGIGQDKVAQS